MDDNCFQAAYGGSFLNHQFLVSAAAPVYPNAPSSLQPMLDANGQLALDKNGKIIQDGNITPIGAPFQSAPGQTFDQNCAVNTIYSANLTPVNSNPNSNGLLPSQNDSNLDGAGVSWKWYSGGLGRGPGQLAHEPGQWGQDPLEPNGGPQLPVAPLVGAVGACDRHRVFETHFGIPGLWHRGCAGLPEVMGIAECRQAAESGSQRENDDRLELSLFVA